MTVPRAHRRLAYRTGDNERVGRDEVVNVVGRRGRRDEKCAGLVIVKGAVGDHGASVGKARQIPLVVVEQTLAQVVPAVIRVLDDPERHVFSIWRGTRGVP